MKHLLVFLTVLFAAFSAAQAQHKEPTNEELQAAHAASKARWAEAKKQCNDTYQYTLTCFGGEGDWRHHIRVSVVAGKIKKAEKWRSHIRTGKISKQGYATYAFNEEIPLQTLDGIYDFAEKEVFTKDPAEFYRSFTADPKTGLVQRTSYYPHNLADACDFGFVLETLELSKP